MKFILNILQNFYFISSVCFGIWICFFDTNNILNQMSLSEKYHEFKAEKIYYTKEIESLNLRLKKLEDVYYLKKLAREKYDFKKKGEDVYLIREIDGK